MRLSLPHILTLCRLLAPLGLCPLLILTDETWRLPLAIAFTLFALTDWMDGWLARRLGQTSRWGEILDPIADKILVLLVLLALIIRSELNALAYIFIFVVFARELIMSGLRAGSPLAQSALQVSTLSRTKTLLTYVACGLLILGEGFEIKGFEAGSLEIAGTLILGVSLIPGILSLIFSIGRAS